MQVILGSGRKKTWRGVWGWTVMCHCKWRPKQLTPTEWPHTFKNIFTSNNTKRPWWWFRSHVQGYCFFSSFPALLSLFSFFSDLSLSCLDSCSTTAHRHMYSNSIHKQGFITTEQHFPDEKFLRIRSRKRERESGDLFASGGCSLSFHRLSLFFTGRFGSFAFLFLSWQWWVAGRTRAVSERNWGRDYRLALCWVVLYFQTVNNRRTGSILVFFTFGFKARLVVIDRMVLREK